MLADTIVAESSAPGAGERAVLRLSGPAARRCAEAVFAPCLPTTRAQVDGAVRVRGRDLPAFALVMPGPASFTGEDTVELHVPGGPLLVQTLLDALLAAGGPQGLRMALPGEFTARAFTNGRLDLAAAEGILMLLHAADAADAAAAMQWLGGGMRHTIDGVRERVLDALALLEAGLDFTDEETGAVPAADWLAELLPAAEGLDRLRAALPAAAPGGEVLLLGRSNVGKSSLCNALVGREVSLVDAQAGTTRDLLRHEVAGAAVWDAPGDLDDPGAADAAALALRDRLAGRAAGALWVLDAAGPIVTAAMQRALVPCLGLVWTRCDLVPDLPAVPPAAASAAAHLPVFRTSAARGEGIDELRTWLARFAHGGAAGPGAPLRAELGAAAAAIDRARAAAGIAEVAAAELQQAVRALDGLVGAHSAEPLLDRIYGRFCLGK